MVVRAVTRSPGRVVTRSRRPLSDLQATYAVVEFDSDNVSASPMAATATPPTASPPAHRTGRRRRPGRCLAREGAVRLPAFVIDEDAGLIPAREYSTSTESEVSGQAGRVHSWQLRHPLE